MRAAVSIMDMRNTAGRFIRRPVLSPLWKLVLRIGIPEASLPPGETAGELLLRKRRQRRRERAASLRPTIRKDAS